MALVSLPPHHFDFDDSFEGHVKAIEVLVRECSLAKEMGLKVKCFAGVHPASIENEISKDPKRGLEIVEKAIRILDHVAKLISEGLVDGFGEVGRPHYKASPEAFVANHILLHHALELARDLSAPIHLHLEQGGALTAANVERLVEIFKIKRELVIMHHLDLSTAKAAQERGLVFTIPGKRGLLKEAFRSLRPSYMVESDFIDDPKRPGVSAYPWEMVERQRGLLSEGVIDYEYLYKLNVDNVVMVYGVEPP